MPTRAPRPSPEAHHAFLGDGHALPAGDPSSPIASVLPRPAGSRLPRLWGSATCKARSRSQRTKPWKTFREAHPYQPKANIDGRSAAKAAPSPVKRQPARSAAQRDNVTPGEVSCLPSRTSYGSSPCEPEFPSGAHQPASRDPRRRCNALLSAADDAQSDSVTAEVCSQ